MIRQITERIILQRQLINIQVILSSALLFGCDRVDKQAKPLASAPVQLELEKKSNEQDDERFLFVSFPELPFLIGKHYVPPIQNNPDKVAPIHCSGGWSYYEHAPIKIKSGLKRTYLSPKEMFTLNQKIEIIKFSPNFLSNNKSLTEVTRNDFNNDVESLSSIFNGCKKTKNRFGSGLKCKNYSVSYLDLAAFRFLRDDCQEELKIGFDEWVACDIQVLQTPPKKIGPTPECDGCYGYSIVIYSSERVLEELLRMKYQSYLVYTEENSHGNYVIPPEESCGVSLF